MQRLLAYSAAAYDANCIIYYCLHCQVQVKRRSGEVYVVQHDGLTQLVKQITKRLITDGKLIKTIKAIMDEVKENLVDAVRKRLNEPEVRRGMSLERIEPFPQDLQLQIIEKCLKSKKDLEAKGWFSVDDYRPERTKLDQVKAFFEMAGEDPLLRDRLKPGKSRMPGSVDLHLMVYSKATESPILTNDSHFTAFGPELRAHGHVTEVVELRSVQL